MNYTKKEDCLSHDKYDEIRHTGKSVFTTKVIDLLNEIKCEFGDGAALEFNFEIISEFICPDCNDIASVLKPLESLTEESSLCQKCKKSRIANTFHSIEGSESFLEKTFSEIGIPPYDSIIARKELNQILLMFDGDENYVLDSFE